MCRKGLCINMNNVTIIRYIVKSGTYIIIQGMWLGVEAVFVSLASSSVLVIVIYP